MARQLQNVPERTIGYIELLGTTIRKSDGIAIDVDKSDKWLIHVLVTVFQNKYFFNDISST